MIIDKVVINNFYCFLGENQLPFSKGLNIISALNAGGKSQLFNAFHWTFFNKIYVDNDRGKKEWKSADNVIVCPDYLKLNTHVGEKIFSSVEITLTSEYHLNDEPENDLATYTFLRKVTYEKNSGRIIVVSKPELTISFVRNAETDFIGSHQHSSFLDQIFPPSVRKFMWYQGETMDELYDFSNPSTLKNAIKEISYFPIYDNMEKIVKSSALSIEKKIEKELSRQNKLNFSQQKLINEINITTRTINEKEIKRDELKNDIEKLQDDVAEVEHKLKGYDKYRDIKETIIKLEAELSLTKNRIDDIDIVIKETLINKWMLNACEHMIDAASDNLNILNQEIQDFQKTNNPVPMSLPGPEYVEKMIEDHICYICERSVKEDTPEFKALQRRLNDFENNANYKLLQDSYTELNRARKRLINELPNINTEVEDNRKMREDLFKKRSAISRKIKATYENSGEEDEKTIFDSASTATQLLNKLNSLKNSTITKNKYLNIFYSEIENAKEELNKKMIERDNMLKNIDTNIVESEAANYINMFVKGIGKLRAIAYNKLIDEIQIESNRLYTSYLGGNSQGEIVINNGITIIDRYTKEPLTELNTAELVAEKLAVANAFLSLSEKKMNRAYPIVADAPTSDFDPENTYNLTINIGHSFDQMIIMSKDYSLLTNDKRTDLIKEAEVEKFYVFKNDKIDANGEDSRTNRKTYITTVK